MPRFIAPVSIAQLEFESSATAKYELGQIARTMDGRKFRYVLAGAANLVPGNLIQTAAPVSDHINCVVAAAAAIGNTTPKVTLGSTAVAQDFYAGGLLIVSTTPGGGYKYTVKSHPQQNASLNVVVTLLQTEGIQVGMNTTSRVDLVSNPYSGVIQNPTTQTGAVAGAAVYPIVNGQYGWIQTNGPAAVLVEGTPAAGSAVSPSANVNGAVSVASLAAQAANVATTSTTVGHMLEVGVNGKWKAVMLHID